MFGAYGIIGMRLEGRPIRQGFADAVEESFLLGTQLWAAAKRLRRVERTKKGGPFGCAQGRAERPRRG